MQLEKERKEEVPGIGHSEYEGLAAGMSLRLCKVCWFLKWAGAGVWGVVGVLGQGFGAKRAGLWFLTIELGFSATRGPSSLGGHFYIKQG